MKTPPESNDPFERRLAEVPLAQAPEDWRDAILSAARAARSEMADRPRPSALRWLRAPWLILGGAWAVVAALALLQHQIEATPHLAGFRGGANHRPLDAASLAAARAFQRELMTSLDGDTWAEDVDSPPPPSPSPADHPSAPRSEFRPSPRPSTSGGNPRPA